MKVKKYIGQTINGFKIIDTYAVNLPSGAKTRKVLLECENCGRKFERQSGVDFEHIKCKCMCTSEPKSHKIKYKWNGEEYYASELCRMYDISGSTFAGRIKAGYPLEEILTGRYKKECPICKKDFISEKPSRKYCCKTCKIRAMNGQGEYKQPHMAACVVCGTTFSTLRDDAKTCSKSCRTALARIDRNKRYKKLKEEGRFDESVTLINVFIRDRGVCQNCGLNLDFECDVTSDAYPSIDHIIPLSRGGAHEWNNVQLLCRKCNYEKGAKS